MFGLFRPQNPYEQPAQQLYAASVERTRDPCFYQEFQVPDTLDGRFDLLLLHIFLILNRLQDEGQKGKALSQTLFDVTFMHTDQGLRENGIGDMGIRKHMRRMMIAFNGRMHSYQKALKQDTLEAALARNLYGTLEKPPTDMLQRMADYMVENAAFIKGQQSAGLLDGKVSFSPLEEIKQYGT